MGVFEYSRGVEWQGWGGMFLIFSLVALVAWAIALLIEPAAAEETWPFLVFAAFFAVVGWALRAYGRKEEQEAREEGGPGVP